jgi:hypothetical protein
MKKLIALILLSGFMVGTTYATDYVKSPKHSKVKKMSIKSKKKSVPPCPPDCDGTNRLVLPTK